MRMVLCIVAAVVFGVLSVFSARYRPLAKEGFHCAFRMVTFRKCDVHLEEKLKAGITGRLMMYHPQLASSVYHNFKVLSWIFMVVFFSSMIYTGVSAYNIAVHGTCDPAGGQCIFVPDAGGQDCIQADAPASAPDYFDNNAKVMFFYRDGCPWCTKEKEALALLAKDGYRVKPMHLDVHPEYWNQYKIQATPTFIGPDGKKFVGYMEYMPLREMLDSYM